MKILCVKEMQMIDRIASQEYGISPLILMENAGRAIADETAKLALRNISGKSTAGMKIAVFCGGGNNGGDGFVAARYLHNRGFATSIISLKNPGSYTGESGTNLAILKKLKLEVIEYACFPMEKRREMLEESVAGCAVIIDAILGTGFKPPVSAEYETVISFLNSSEIPVLSADIPSGLDGDKGIPLNLAVKAEVTVALGFAKRGHFENDGPKYTGQLIVADIGFPPELNKR